MSKFNEGISTTPPPEIIPDQSLWYKGRDGKFYATEEGLKRAQEEWLENITYDKPPQDKIINNEKEKPPSLINKKEIQPPKILTSNLLKELTEIPADQLRALSDLLRSLPPPPTSSIEQK